MTGTPLSKMRLPGRRYDPAVLCRDFEAYEYAISEDRKLITCLRRAVAKGGSLVDRDHAYRLEQRLIQITNPDLDEWLEDIEFKSLSSKTQGRETRRAICGAILAYLDSYKFEEIAAITLVNYRHMCPPVD